MCGRPEPFVSGAGEGEQRSPFVTLSIHSDVELAIRKPLFRGKDYADQLRKILGILGTPSPSDVDAIPDQGARDFVRALPHYEPVAWCSLWRTIRPAEEALLDGMLAFNPAHRLSLAECLASPVFDEVRGDDDDVVDRAALAGALHLPFVDAQVTSVAAAKKLIADELVKTPPPP